VCFQPFQSDRRDSDESTLFGEGEDEISERKKNLLVRKALECGLQLLARLSHYRVYLTAEERSRHRAPYEEEWDSKEAIFDAMNPNDSSSSQNTDLNNENTSKKSSGDRSISREEGMASVDYWKSCFQNINSGKKKKNIKKDNKKRKQSDVSDKTTKHINQNSGIDLELHMALSCGNVTNIILGDLDPRESATHQHPASFPQLRTDNANTTNPSGPNVVMDEFFLEYHGRLEYAIGGPVVDALDEALSIAKAGEMSLTESAYEVIQRQSLALVFEPRRRFYVMNDIVDKVPLRKSHLPSRSSTGTHSRKGSGVGNCNSDYLRSLPGLYTHGTRLEVEPLIPRIRNTSFMNIPINSNSDFFKYINRSALYRLRHSIDDTLPAQFRDVTIMFVSLGKTDVTTREGLYNVQKAVLVAIQVLVKYEGMLQQFAIDDKGIYTARSISC
jgi:hypothetical protein